MTTMTVRFRRRRAGVRRLLAAALIVRALVEAASAAPCALPSVQQPATAAVAVAIGGDVAKPFTLTATEADRFATLHAIVRQPSDYGPVDGDFAGVSVADLLQAAGATAKAGKAGLIDATVLARAALDDPSSNAPPYEVALSTTEVTPALTRHPAFLAFHCNGEPISPTLVAPDDLTSARYVHELSALVLRVPR